MNQSTTRCVVLLLAVLGLAGGAFVGCSTDSPTTPSPPQGPGTPPSLPSGTWNITVTANPPQIQLPPPGQAVPTSSLLIQVRRAADNAPPPAGATIAVAVSGGTINGQTSLVATLTNGQVSLTFTPTTSGTAVVQAQLEGSVGQALIDILGVEEIEALVLSHISPNVVDPAGGQVIDIFGEGILAPVRVNIGGTDAEVLQVQSNRIRVRVPPRPGVDVGTTQSVNVSVTSGLGTPFQASDTLTGALIYAHGGTTIQPAIFSVTPTTGPNEGGTVVTIRGTGFQSPVQVRFGVPGTGGPGAGSQVEAEIVSVTASEIRVLSPAARAFGQGNLNNPVDITVINLESGFRTTLAEAFRYGVSVIITAMGPGSGPHTGGTTVTVHGQGFEAPVAVSLGGIGQQVLSVSGSQILFRTSAFSPAPACGGQSTPQPLSVTNIATGDSGTGPSFVFLGPPGPTITGVFPAIGNQAGGFDVTITGSGFESPVRVEFGDQTAPEASVNASGTQVVAVAPAFTGTFEQETCFVNGAQGTRFVPTSVDVTVTNLSNECTATVSKGFTYVPTDQTCHTAPLPPPTASFTFGGAAGTRTVNFVDTSSGNPTSWLWNFGDGTTSTQQHPTHTYAVDGTYGVSLTVTNEAGSDTTSQQVTVPLGPAATPPTASFTFGGVAGTRTVNFSDTSSGNPTSWLWNFGDGSPTSTLQNPSHTYAADGTYGVTLTVSNSGGSNATSQQVTVPLP